MVAVRSRNFQDKLALSCSSVLYSLMRSNMACGEVSTLLIFAPILGMQAWGACSCHHLLRLSAIQRSVSSRRRRWRQASAGWCWRRRQLLSAAAGRAATTAWRPASTGRRGDSAGEPRAATWRHCAEAAARRCRRVRHGHRGVKHRRWRWWGILRAWPQAN